MSAKVDLYDSSYGNYALEVYREVRLETYGEDFGLTSWVTTRESREIPVLLELKSGSAVLEIGCGSGHYALHVAESCNCHITGLDLNAEGIRNTCQLAEHKKLSSRASFQRCEVSQTLPFGDESFDAIFANDVLCHVPGRFSLLCEARRALKPGGGLLFSDALVVGGMLSNDEIATRSSIGHYYFVPPGENERLIEQAGFQLLRSSATTEQAATVAQRWHDARAKRKKRAGADRGRSKFCRTATLPDVCPHLDPRRAAAALSLPGSQIVCVPVVTFRALPRIPFCRRPALAPCFPAWGGLIQWM
jgi:ubiquinone/menaquinone biosynthesis C-methylase UbiE